MPVFNRETTGDEVVKAFFDKIKGKTGENRSFLSYSSIITPVTIRALKLPLLITCTVVVLITGPSQSGIGAQSAMFLAAGKPKLIILAGRSEGKIQPVIDEIKQSHPDVSTSYIKLDLADNKSVRQAAEAVNAQIDKLDILINNAGGRLLDLELYLLIES